MMRKRGWARLTNGQQGQHESISTGRYVSRSSKALRNGEKAEPIIQNSEVDMLGWGVVANSFKKGEREGEKGGERNMGNGSLTHQCGKGNEDDNLDLALED
jgi:hypothetical protein